MININGYTIQDYPNQNKIVIGLPQTPETATSTIGGIVNRKRELTQDELIQILTYTMQYYL